MRAVSRVIRSGWMTTGPEVRRFEAKFAEYLGVNRAVALNSCTGALHLSLLALDIKAGDEVIVPTMTFAATAEVLHYVGARPVLVDCRPDTLNMDPDCFARAVTRKTRAVIVVHFAGQPCDMDPILAVARSRKIKVIEDAAHAPPAFYKGRAVGSLGDMACFSFHAIKTMTTGEGGMLVTSRDEYAEKVRILSLHGISKDAWKRYSAGGTWRYEISMPGYKYNMTDIAAAMGLCQLEKCEDAWAVRRRYAGLYAEGFKDLPEVRVPVTAPGTQHAWHLYVIQLELARLRISRDAFIDALSEANIGTSVHFIPLHMHPYYRKAYGYRPRDFPSACAASERIISLPLYPKMKKSDVEYVIAAVRRIAARHRR